MKTISIHEALIKEGRNYSFDAYIVFILTKEGKGQLIDSYFNLGEARDTAKMVIKQTGCETHIVQYIRETNSLNFDFKVF